MKNNKFSKKQVSEDIWGRINALEYNHKFKSYDGWNQVKGKGEEINRAYGEYNCLLSIASQYDLEP